MRKTLALLLPAVLALAGFLSGPASAQELTGKGLKPVAAIAFSGTGQLIDDLNFFGSLSGNPQLGTALEMSLRLLTGGRELTTLDKSKPWGAVVLTDGQQFTALGFLPLGDLDELRQVLALHVAGIEERGKGRLIVPVEGQRLYLKAQNGWVYAGNVAEALDRVPADPIAALEGLHNSYNLAVRIHVQNIPALFRAYFVGAVQMGIQAGLARTAGENDEQAARNKIAQNAFQQVKDSVADLDSIELGLRLDKTTASLTLDYSITAREGTRTAKRLASARDLKSRFAGFTAADAAVSLNAVGRIDDADLERILPAVDSLRAGVLRELDEEDLAAGERQAARQVVDGVASVVVNTLKQRDLDGGALLILNEEQTTCLAGARLADPGKLEEIARAVVAELARLKPELADAVKFDADRHASVRFHTLTIPAAEFDNEAAARLFGDELTVVLGIGESAAYLSAGSAAVETLKKAIDDSIASKDLPPASLVISAGPIAGFLARNAEDGRARTRARMIADSLAGAEGKDRITLNTAAIENGLRVRLQVEQGLLKLLGILPILVGG